MIPHIKTIIPRVREISEVVIKFTQILMVWSLEDGKHGIEVTRKTSNDYPAW